MTLTSLCRASRPLMPPVVQTCAPARAMGSLSGIHRGIRRSDQNTRLSDSGKPMTYRQRQEARANAPPPPFRMMRGKKDVTEYPNKAPKAQTRKGRFFDPDSSFGKKSLVYKMKTGKIADEFGGDVFSAKIRGFGSDNQDSGTRGRGWRGRSGGSSPKEINDFGESESTPPGSSLFSVGGGRDRDSGGPRDSGDRSRSVGHSRGGPRDFGASKEGRTLGGFREPREERSSGRFGGFGGSREDRPSRSFGGPREDRPSSSFGGVKRRPSRTQFRGPKGRPSRTQFRGPKGRPFGGSREDRPSRSFGGSREDRPSGRDNRDPDETKPSTQSEERPASAAPFRPKSSNPFEDSDGREPRHDHPLSIPYTTAASQFLYGKSVVEAALRGARRKFYKLYIYRGRQEEVTTRQRFSGIYQETRNAQDASIFRLAKEHNIAVVNLRDDSGLRLMNKMSGDRPHNNYVLEASPLPQLPVISLGALAEYPSPPGFHIARAHQSAEEAAITGTSDFLPTPADATHKPLVVLLHGVLDPGNVGALLRSLAFLGATAVATTKRGSAPLSPVALKAAAGASETLTLLTVDSAERFLDESRDAGWEVYAATPPPANGRHAGPHLDMRGVEDRDPLREKPCILLLGSEGEGLGKAVLRRADFDVSIPNVLDSEVVDSLNVSVAGALLTSAFLRGMVGDRLEKEKVEGRKFNLF
ncbi:RNA methyltransferase [Podospora conica]|nr:RNA methyltransferase [Schizothecium conicum]